MIDRLIPYYSSIKKEDLKFHIVEYADQLLPDMDKNVGKYTLRKFLKNNINVHLNTALEEVTQYQVFMSGKKENCYTYSNFDNRVYSFKPYKR